MIKECSIIALNNNAWQVYTINADDYRSLLKRLNIEKNPLVHVMARVLYPTYQKDGIVRDLKEKGFKILDVVNVFRIEKNPMKKEKQ